MPENIFKAINERIEKDKKKEESETQKMYYIPSILITKPYLEVLQDIDNISDYDLYELIKINYNQILKEIFRKENADLVKIITNTRFLSIFIQVINCINISEEERIYCNKMAYDYITMPNISNNKVDEHVKQLFISLSNSVNKHVLPGLLSLGLDEQLASMLAICRFSSMKEFVNVRRINHIMICSDPTVMTSQNIIYIYEKLFDKFTDLFIATMYDVYDDVELEAISYNASEIYSNISLAIVDILNSMTSVDIRKVLLAYGMDYALDMNRKIRFSINTLAQCDYNRIYQIVDNLLVYEGINVP